LKILAHLCSHAQRRDLLHNKQTVTVTTTTIAKNEKDKKKKNEKKR
jgi:hypothetical protein